MRISVVIPNRNSGAVLERAVRSLLGQSYPDLQIVVADAESSDESAAVIERYQDQFHALVRRPDSGPAEGLNHGFALADGEIFAWLAADDELMPGSLEHVAGMFLRHPEADVVTGGCERVYADGERAVIPPDPTAFTTITLKDTIEQPATFWRARLHRSLGELDTSYRQAFDWDWWCRMQKRGARLLTTERVLARYHFSAHSITSTSGERHVTEGFRIIRKYGPWGGLPAYAYRFLYRHFDLHGCWDDPPAGSPARHLALAAILRLLRGVFGERVVELYNWHFASLQQRGRKWW